MARDFAAALDDFEREDAAGTRLFDPFLRLLPVTGVSVATVGPFLGSQTLAASDSLAERIDEVQFDLGEGPCWDALRTGEPVLAPTFADEDGRWPVFTEAVRLDELGALFAFPLKVGGLRLGAVDLYSTERRVLTHDHLEQAGRLAGVVSRHVLRDALRKSSSDDDDPTPDRYSRRLVHQATGVVLAQLRLPADDAHLLIQGHAFATGASMRETAEEILAGRLVFAADGDFIDTNEEHE